MSHRLCHVVKSFQDRLSPNISHTLCSLQNEDQFAARTDDTLHSHREGAYKLVQRVINGSRYRSDCELGETVPDVLKE
jgi:hypothetical protein